MKYILAKIMFINVICLCFINCASTEKFSSKDKQTFTKISEWVDNNEFTIVSDWANPLGGGQVNLYGNMINISSLVNASGGGGRINLIGNPNEVSIIKDSARVYLPYFGRVQVVKNYGGRGGIDFEGIPTNYEVTKNEEKHEIKIEFDIQDESENLQVNIQLYANGTAHIALNSAYRNSISYDGHVEKLREALQPEKEDPNDYFIHD